MLSSPSIPQLVAIAYAQALPPPRVRTCRPTPSTFAYPLFLSYSRHLKKSIFMIKATASSMTSDVCATSHEDHYLALFHFRCIPWPSSSSSPVHHACLSRPCTISIHNHDKGFHDWFAFLYIRSRNSSYRVSRFHHQHLDGRSHLFWGWYRFALYACWSSFGTRWYRRWIIEMPEQQSDKYLIPSSPFTARISFAFFSSNTDCFYRPIIDLPLTLPGSTTRCWSRSGPVASFLHGRNRYPAPKLSWRADGRGDNEWPATS